MPVNLKYTYDLSQPCRPDALNIPLYEGDKNSLHINVAVMDNGLPATFQSGATAKLILLYPDRKDAINIDCDTITGNNISVTAPSTPLVGGRISMFIKLTDGASIITVWAATAFVEWTTNQSTEIKTWEWSE